MTKLSKIVSKDQQPLSTPNQGAKKLKSTAVSTTQVQTGKDELSKQSKSKVQKAIEDQPTWSADAGGAPAGRTAGPRLGAKKLSLSARPSFAERPQVHTDNETWERMTTSRGTSFDVFTAGRVIDADLLHELARYHRDPMDKAQSVAELAGLGIVHGKAFQQVTNNTNFKAWEQSLETRVAFALAVAAHGGEKTLDAYFHAVHSMSKESVAPLEKLWKTAKIKEPFESWSATYLEAAPKVLAAAKKNTLTKSAIVAEMLLGQLKNEASDGLPVGLEKLSAGALVGYRAARDNGASPEHAFQIAKRVDKGELDPYTMRLLSPSKPGGDVAFRDHFPNAAVVGKVAPEDAASIAADVARGDLGLGQLRGFYVRFGSMDEEFTPKLNLPNASKIVQAVNRGEIDPSQLEKVMDPDTYFSPKLAKKVWDRMFSGTAPSGGNKYTTSGIASPSDYTAPLTARLTYDIVAQLAASPAKLETFRSVLAEDLVDALPSKQSMNKRADEPGNWEVPLYDGAMQTAFMQAAAAAKLQV